MRRTSLSHGVLWGVRVLQIVRDDRRYEYMIACKSFSKSLPGRPTSAIVLTSLRDGSLSAPTWLWAATEQTPFRYRVRNQYNNTLPERIFQASEHRRRRCAFLLRLSIFCQFVPYMASRSSKVGQAVYQVPHYLLSSLWSPHIVSNRLQKSILSDFKLVPRIFSAWYF